MSAHRRAAKRDAGEQAIVDELVACGASVEKLSIEDAPDLLIGYLGMNLLAEVKGEEGPRGGTSGDGRHLSPGQQEWHAAWEGSVVVLRTPAQANAYLSGVRTALEKIKEIREAWLSEVAAKVR